MTEIKSSYALGELAALLELKLEGDADLEIRGLASLGSATAAHLSFYTGKASWRGALRDTNAAAVLLRPSDAADCPCARLLSENPYLSYARVSGLFKTARPALAGAHASAVIEEDAEVAPGASIGPHCHVGVGAVIEDAVCLEAGVFVGAGAHIGSASVVRANAVIEHGVSIGSRAIIHAAAVIGADGFGFAPDAGGWRKIEQLGSVRVGVDVEIGAGTTIDRGALDDTIVEDGVKLDDQVHIGHNCRIGAGSILSSGVSLGGSVRVGRGCRIGGCVIVNNDVNIAEETEIHGASVVLRDLPTGRYSSTPTAVEARHWRRSFAHLLNLEDWVRRLKHLEREVRNG